MPSFSAFLADVSAFLAAGLAVDLVAAFLGLAAEEACVRLAWLVVLFLAGVAFLAFAAVGSVLEVDFLGVALGVVLLGEATFPTLALVVTAFELFFLGAVALDVAVWAAFCFRRCGRLFPKVPLAILPRRVFMSPFPIELVKISK